MSARLEALMRDTDHGLFMPFLVAGDPDFETSLALAGALVEAGADILELGFPFSDPVADGPIIQAADARALAAGTTPERAFELLAALRARHDRPMVLLMYFNLILQYGVERFYARARDVGVDAVLVADLPIEMAGKVVAAANAAGVAPVFIASAVSTDARLARVAEVGRGFVYTVAHLGVTGVRDEVDGGLDAVFARVARTTRLPALAGFGISTPQHVRRVVEAGAAGAIVGSALVRTIEEHPHDRDAALAAMYAAAAPLAEAAHNTTRKPC